MDEVDGVEAGDEDGVEAGDEDGVEAGDEDGVEAREEVDKLFCLGTTSGGTAGTTIEETTRAKRLAQTS